MDPVTLALAKSWAEGQFGDLRQLQQHVQAILDSRIVEHNLDVTNPPNGWYVRWENGLQMCWHWWTQHPFESPMYYVRSGDVRWTYPAAFAAVPATMVQGRPAFWLQPWRDSSYAAADYGGLSTTPSENNLSPGLIRVRVVYWYRTYSGRLDMFAFAIGRWK